VTLARNLITQSDFDPFFFENREQTRSRGIGSRRRAAVPNGILARASFVVQRTQDPARRAGAVELAA
jgi:hypothetical protein